MEKGDKGSTLTRMGVSGLMFLLVPAYQGCPGQTAVKWLLLLLLVIFCLLVGECIHKVTLCWNVCARSQAGVSRHCRRAQAEDSAVAVDFDFRL